VISLESLGWNQNFHQKFQQSVGTENSNDLVVGRVIEEQRDLYLVAFADRERWSSLTGRMRNEPGAEGFPAVGDWVLARCAHGDDRARIERVIPRRSCFRRKAPETGLEQVIAANIDVAFVVAALGGDFNLRRIERYLAAVWDSGAQPVVVLTKADLRDDVEDVEREVDAIAPGVRIISTSSLRDHNIHLVRSLIEPGSTAVIIGSSGTGKSTLVNKLLGFDAQYVSHVSDHLDKGRHTTTSRKLITLPGGGMIIDTPGMRELQFYDVGEGVSRTFEDVERLITSCKFSDCAHRTEPGCAIRSALDDGSLDADRWKSFQKLEREAAYQARELDANAARVEKERWKKITMQNRKRMDKGFR